MLARLRSHLTFANVVSLLALFVALSGGAYALTLPKNSVGARELKKNAVRGSEIKRGTVTSSKMKDGSLLSKDFKAGQLPAGPPGERGQQGTAGVAATRLFGNFNGDDGARVRGSGIVSSERTSDGFYRVQFNQSITQCVLLASPSSIDGTNSSSVTVGAAYLTADTAFVLIRNDFADTREDADFSLAALC